MKKIALLLAALLVALASTLALLLREPAHQSEFLSPRAGDAPARALAFGGELAAPQSTGDATARGVDPSRRALAAAPEPAPQRGREGEARGPSADGPFLSGSVVDANGIGVSGAEVSVEAEGDTAGLILGLGSAKPLSATTRTSASGTFRVARGSHGSGPLSVEVRARGFLLRGETLSPDAQDGPGRLGTIVLESGVVLGGVVTDARGVPVPGASVLRTTREEEHLLDGILGLAARMEGGGLERAQSDAEGRFELEHEKPGEFVLIFEHPAHPRGRLEGTTPRAGGEQQGLELRFAPSARISGRVLGFPRGRRHVIVQAEPEALTEEQEAALVLTFFDEVSGSSGPSVEVAEDGSFELGGLCADANYGLRALVKFGMFERTQASDLLSVRAPATGVELTWDAGARVSFDVRDAETDRALDQVDVRYLWQDRGSSLVPTSTRKEAFESGRVELNELRPDPAPGLLDLLVSAPGYLEQRELGVVVDARAAVDLGIVRLRRAPRVRVRVVDAVRGEPIDRARVSLSPEDESCVAAVGADEDVPYAYTLASRGSSEKTDDDGWCELQACASATASLHVSRSGFVDLVRTGLAMPRDGGLEEVVLLARGGTVEVRVVDGTGRPVPGARVFRRLADEASDDAREASAKGQALFKGLGAGEHAFRATRPGASGNVRVAVSVGAASESPGGWQSVLVSAGETAHLDLTVPSSASVRGRLSAAGVPVAGIPVVFLPGPDPSDADAILTRVTESFAAMMSDASARTRTDDEGRYRLDDVAVGRHRLHVSPAPGAPPHVVVVDLLEGENVVDIELPGGVVEGRVLDTAGAPVAGARVHVAGADVEDVSGEITVALTLFGADPGGVRSDYDGTFVVHGVPAEVPLRARVEADGFVPGSSEEFRVAEGHRRRGLDVTLQRGGSIEVTLPAGVGPFTLVRAFFEGELDPPVPGLDRGVVTERHALAQRGKCLFEGLNPGPWRVATSGSAAEDGASAEGTLVEVRPGERSLVRLDP